MYSQEIEEGELSIHLTLSLSLYVYVSICLLGTLLAAADGWVGYCVTLPSALTLSFSLSYTHSLSVE